MNAPTSMTQVTFEMPARDIRRRIRNDLPPDAFARRPWLGLWLIPSTGLIIVISVLIVNGSIPIVFTPLLSIFMGALYGSMWFLGHEISHGAVVRTQWLQTTMLYWAFAVFLLSPHLWQIWHVQVHHSQANIRKRDPDNYGYIEDIDDILLKPIALRFAPGSSFLISILYLFVSFTIFGQTILWFAGVRYQGFERLNQRRAALDSLFMAAFWVILGGWLGPLNALWIIIIPMMIANYSIMSYIITNHSLRPFIKANEPIENSMSVTSFKLFDWLFFNFSHHIEHHLFPRMSSAFLPLVRKWLIEHVPNRYLAPPHWRALFMIYKTPRVHGDNDTLVDPFTGREVSIREVEANLRKHTKWVGANAQPTSVSHTPRPPE